MNLSQLDNLKSRSCWTETCLETIHIEHCDRCSLRACWRLLIIMCRVRSDNITWIEVHHGILFDRRLAFDARYCLKIRFIFNSFFDILVHPRKFYTHDRPAKIHPEPATIYLWPATIYVPPRRLDSLLPLMLFYDLIWYQYYYFDMICFVNCLKWVFVSVWCNVKQCRLFVCLLLSFYKAFFSF